MTTETRVVQEQQRTAEAQHRIAAEQQRTIESLARRVEELEASSAPE